MSTYPLPIAELVTRNVIETLTGVSSLGVGENNVPLTVERLKTAGKNLHGDMVCIVGFDDDQEDDSAPDNYTGWIRPYWALVYLYEPDDSAIPYDQRVDIVRADISKAIMVDVARGDYAENTFLRAPLKFSDANDASGIIINFDVHYRHIDTDPYTK